LLEHYMPWHLSILHAVASNSHAERGSFFDDLVRCETRLYNALSERLRESHDLVASQFELLRFVRDHPGARVADLAAYFAIGIGATSKGVDRQERRGWIRRERNPEDRRSSVLVITDEGAELLAAAEVTFQQCLADLLGPLSGRDRFPETAALMADLRRTLEAGQVGVPAG
jgi:MarR family multiple antibiotic resistance transcriptional regulator